MAGVDPKRIEDAVKEILLAVGEDPTREGLIETPRRIARMINVPVWKPWSSSQSGSRYLLEGLESQWTSAEASRIVFFKQLKKGVRIDGRSFQSLFTNVRTESESK